MRYIGSCLLGMSLILWGGQAAAQELSCTVSIELRALEGTGVEFLRQLKPQIEEYLNQHRWTEDLFELQERIECALQIVFVQRDGDQYTAQLAVTSRRPIYGSDQQTVVLQLVEPRWSFRYVQGQPLVHNLEQFDELTSTLDFYAYLILGYDYDTFSPQGGTRFLEIARRIVDLAQRGRSTAVEAFGGAKQPLLAYKPTARCAFHAVSRGALPVSFSGSGRLPAEP